MLGTAHRVKLLQDQKVHINLYHITDKGHTLPDISNTLQSVCQFHVPAMA